MQAIISRPVGTIIERYGFMPVCAVFAVHGFIFASWAVRVPAIKEQVGASSAALGLALLGLSAGAVASIAIATMLWLIRSGDLELQRKTALAQ